jgi:hypothetical protein
VDQQILRELSNDRLLLHYTVEAFDLGANKSDA